MTIVSVFVFAVVTFAVLPLAVYAGAASLMSPRTTGERVRLFLLTAPLTPLALGLVLMGLYSAPVHPTSTTAIVTVLAAFSAMLLYGRIHIPPLLSDLKAGAKQARVTWTVPDLLLALLFVVVVVQIATLPLMENDAIEYAAVARHIFESRTLGVYPILEAAPNGLFAPSSHPPAYHMYLVWGYAWLGVENFAPARLLALYCLLGMAALLARALYRHGRRTVVFAFLLLLMVPLYVGMLVGYHIDALRLVAFLAAAIAVADVIERPSDRQAVLTGAILGFAAFAHSIGILAWAFGGLTWLLLRPNDRWRNYRVPLIIGAVAIAVGGAQFIKNLAIYGVPLQDSAPIWEMPELGFAADLKYRRDLLVPYDRFVYGVLRGFVELRLYGVLFWLAAFASWRIWRHWRLAPLFQQVAVIWVVSFFAIAAATALVGSELVVKNARYVLTLAPLLVALAAPMLADWRHDTRRQRFVLAGALCLMSGWMLVHSAVRTAYYGGRLDLWTAGERAPIHRARGRFPGAPLYRYIEKHLKPGEKTLVFRQAEFTLYGTGDWLDNFDTRLEPFYRLARAEDAHHWLRAREVRYVLVPGYTFPTYYRTVAGQLLGDTRLVEYIASHRGFHLYRLRDAAIATVCQSIDQKELSLYVWRQSHSGLTPFAQNAGLSFLENYRDTFVGRASPSIAHQRAGPAHQIAMTSAYDQRLRLITGAGPISFPPDEPWAQVGSDGATVKVSLQLTGKGFFAIDLVEYVDTPSDVQQHGRRLWDGVVSDKSNTVELQFIPSRAARGYRLAIFNVGRAPGSVEIGDTTICKSAPPPKTDAAPQAASGGDTKSAGMPLAAPPGEAKTIARWPAQRFVTDCEPSGAGACTPAFKNSYAREQLGDAVRFLGDLDRVQTPGFRVDLAARWSLLLETLRIALERAPEGTLNTVLRPLYDWLAHTVPETDLAPHVMNLNVSGIGVYSVILQYVTPDGRRRFRSLGAFFLTPEKTKVRLAAQLPKDAARFELGVFAGAYYGGPSSLRLGEASLERLIRP